jgi:acetyl esterase/lipase
MKHSAIATASFLGLFLAFAALDHAVTSADTTDTKKPRAAPPGVKVERDLPYLGADRREKLDLYLPANRARGVLSPAVVVIHGGGWVRNDKADHREFVTCTTLANRGYVCVSINYWMDKATLWPRTVLDCKNAVRWLRKNAAKYQVDANHIGVLGASAGGHLALMVAYTSDVKDLAPPTPYPGISDSVTAVVDLYGISNLLTRQHVGKRARGNGTWYASNLRPSPLGKRPKLKPGLTVLAQAEARIGKADLVALWQLASPVYHVRKDSPPTLIIHGTADTVVNIEQSTGLASQLDENKVANRYIQVGGAPHAFALDGAYKDVGAAVVAFFDKHLKP